MRALCLLMAALSLTGVILGLGLASLTKNLTVAYGAAASLPSLVLWLVLEELLVRSQLTAADSRRALELVKRMQADGSPAFLAFNRAVAEEQSRQPQPAPPPDDAEAMALLRLDDGGVDLSQPRRRA